MTERQPTNYSGRGGQPAPHSVQQRREIHRDQARRRNGRRHNRRRKSSRLAFRVILLVLLLGVIACAALTLLCKAETIEVVGSTRYDPALVIQASGVSQGDSLLMMSGSSISSKVSTALPYVQKIILHRTLPSKVVLEVVEAVPERAYISGSTVALCDGEDKLLERMDAVPLNVPLVLGAELNVGQAGSTVEWMDTQQQDRMDEIVRWLDEAELTGITRYDLRDEVGVTLFYQDALILDFGSQTNFEYKIRFAKEYLDNYYVEGQTGTLDLSLVSGENRKIYFREQDITDRLADTGFIPPDEPREQDSTPVDQAQEDTSSPSELIGDSANSQDAAGG